MKELNYLESKSIETRAIEEALFIAQAYGQNGIDLFSKVFSEVGTKSSTEIVSIDKQVEEECKSQLMESAQKDYSVGSFGSGFNPSITDLANS